MSNGGIKKASKDPSIVLNGKPSISCRWCVFPIQFIVSLFDLSIANTVQNYQNHKETGRDTKKMGQKRAILPKCPFKQACPYKNCWLRHTVYFRLHPIVNIIVYSKKFPPVAKKANLKWQKQLIVGQVTGGASQTVCIWTKMFFTRQRQWLVGKDAKNLVCLKQVNTRFEHLFGIETVLHESNIFFTYSKAHYVLPKTSQLPWNYIWLLWKANQ